MAPSIIVQFSTLLSLYGKVVCTIKILCMDFQQVDSLAAIQVDIAFAKTFVASGVDELSGDIANPD